VTLREAVQKLVQHDGARIRRERWGCDAMADDQEDGVGGLVWDDHERMPVEFTPDDILADDWEVVEMKRQ